jgi:hypothetical protein
MSFAVTPDKLRTAFGLSGVAYFSAAAQRTTE